MIRVKASFGEKGLYLDIQGHAGMAAYGSDVVCAFVSGVGCAMACGLGGGTMDAGHIRIKCRATEKNRAILRAGLSALRMAEEQRPEAITIHELHLYQPASKDAEHHIKLRRVRP